MAKRLQSGGGTMKDLRAGSHNVIAVGRPHDEKGRRTKKNKPLHPKGFFWGGSLPILGRGARPERPAARGEGGDGGTGKTCCQSGRPECLQTILNTSKYCIEGFQHAFTCR